jgi:hypothetical protein
MPYSMLPHSSFLPLQGFGRQAHNQRPQALLAQVQEHNDDEAPVGWRILLRICDGGQTWISNNLGVFVDMKFLKIERKHHRYKAYFYGKT